MARRIAALSAAFLCVAAALPGQSRPESARFAAALERLRAGDAHVESARIVVTDLLGGRHAVAAPWWLGEVLASEEAARLLPAEKEVLGRLRVVIERSDAFSAHKRVALRLIRRLEALVASKCVTCARDAAAIARAFLALVPDATLEKLLTAAESRIPPNNDDEGPGPPWPPGLEEEAATAWRGLQAAALDAYAAAGCRSGRRVIARAFRDAAPLVGVAASTSALARLRALVPRVEPRASLTLLLRTVGGARIFLEGSPASHPDGTPLPPFSAEDHAPLSIPCLPGDLILVSFDEPYASDDAGRSFVVLLHARFEGRDLGVDDLRCIVASHPWRAGAPSFPAPLAQKKSDPPPSLFGRSAEQDAALRQTNAYFALPKTVRREVDVPCLGDMASFQREFDRMRLSPLLLGTEADHFAITIRVP